MNSVAASGLAMVLLAGLCACAGPEGDEGRRVDASGKEPTDLAAVPEEVLTVARAARPDLILSQAEYEIRDGNEYYDVGGTLPDGSELELDVTRLDGVWAVVEVQRDIQSDMVPEEVRAALAAHAPGWRADRVIESDQGDGMVIYEFFGPGESAEPTKIEVKLENGSAEVLADEWLH
jgi:hypothetical protein